MLANNLARLKDNLELEKRKIRSRLNRTSFDSFNGPEDRYKRQYISNSLSQIKMQTTDQPGIKIIKAVSPQQMQGKEEASNPYD